LEFGSLPLVRPDKPRASSLRQGVSTLTHSSGSTCLILCRAFVFFELTDRGQGPCRRIAPSARMLVFIHSLVSMKVLWSAAACCCFSSGSLLPIVGGTCRCCALIRREQARFVRA